MSTRVLRVMGVTGVWGAEFVFMRTVWTSVSGGGIVLTRCILFVLAGSEEGWGRGGVNGVINFNYIIGFNKLQQWWD